MCLGYPEQLNIVRWSLEEAFDPATGVTIPMPDAMRIQLLTSSQERRLGGERAAYRAAKATRIAWANERWMRVPVWGGLGLVGFVDTGNVFAHPRDLDFGELKTAAGFGFRYKSPVGPIRIDLGFKLRRDEIAPGKREGLTALHISLGQAF